MKTIGEILRNERLKKNYQTSQIALAIKIKEKFIFAMENNDFSFFPEEVFALGHIQNYAEFLELDFNEIIPFFRRTWEMKRNQFDEKSKNHANEFVFNSKIDSVGRNFSRIILVSGIGLIIAAFIFFLVLQYERNIIHPKLKIVYPAEDIATSSEKITLKGETDNDDKIFVNGEEIKVDENGFFEFSIDLNQGLNKFVFRAVNPYQKETTVERLILRK